jgi:hypothetical protein
MSTYIRKNTDARLQEIKAAFWSKSRREYLPMTLADVARRVGDDGLLGALNYLVARGDLKAQTVYAGGSRKIKIYEIDNQAVEVAA